MAQQSGNDQAGVASGTLDSVISLRPSTYGGPVGGAGAGAPFQGHLLIADRGNDRLLVIDPARNLQWQYPSATMPPPPGGFYFPDDAFFFHKGTGIISNQEDNHTIVEIGYPSGKILWQYGHPMQPGSSPGYLNQPDDAYVLKNGDITVADAMNDRILFLSPAGAILGQIGTNGVAVHNPPTGVGYPNGDTPLANGDVLVSEINGSWLTEYTPAGKLVWTLHLPTVNYPSDPQQIGPNLYLLADYDPPAEGRILTIRRSGAIVWTYDALSGDAALKKPSLAEQLPNGLIMVNDDYRNRVVAIDPRYDTIVWQYGHHRRRRHRTGAAEHPGRLRPPGRRRLEPDPSPDGLSRPIRHSDPCYSYDSGSGSRSNREEVGWHSGRAPWHRPGSHSNRRPAGAGAARGSTGPHRVRSPSPDGPCCPCGRSSASPSASPGCRSWPTRTSSTPTARRASRPS